MKHLHFKEIPSTQLKAIEMVKETKNLLISAQKQTQGRGRRDNKWEDLDNSLAFSFDIKPTGKPTLLALEIAVLLANFFKEDDLSLKWPNDIYNNKGQKIIGILVNKESDDFIVGIGINYGPVKHLKNSKFGQLSTGHKLEDDDYRNLPLKIYNYIQSSRIDDQTIIKQWNNKSFHLNQECKIIDGNDICRGKFIGIGEYGEALIESQGKVEKAYTGSLLFE